MTAHDMLDRDHGRPTGDAPPASSVTTRTERLVRQVDYAKEIGVNKNTLKQWIRAGLPTVGSLVAAARANAWRREHRPRTLAIARKSSVYFARRESDGAIKIGFSSDVPRRMIEVRKRNRCKIVLLGTCPGGSAVEKRIHRRFASLQIEGEWYRPGDELLTFAATLATPETQAALVDHDYRFHTLNAAQRAQFVAIFRGNQGERATRTLQSLVDRGLIEPTTPVRPGLSRWWGRETFRVPVEVRAAWTEWSKRLDDAEATANG